MTARVWVGKKGLRTVISRCIECPGLPKCEEVGGYSYTASGAIPRDCRLRKAGKREQRMIDNNGGDPTDV